jgi:hypothetical protein
LVDSGLVGSELVDSELVDSELVDSGWLIQGWLVQGVFVPVGLSGFVGSGLELVDLILIGFEIGQVRFFLDISVQDELIDYCLYIFTILISLIST